MPKISVIVPVYKVEPYIRRCVDSILNQTYSDFELLLIDDGSPDNCGKICEEYKKYDLRVKVIHQQNGGLSAARNTGIEWAMKNSNSQWISFVDSDDWIHPEMLERLLGAIEKCSVAMSACGFARTESELPNFSEELLKVKKMKGETFYRTYGVNATVAWGKLYKKECFENLRYPIGKLHEDEFVTYKIIFAAKDIAMIDAPLYAYYINSNGIMNQWNPKRLDSIEAIQERIHFFEERGLIELKDEQEEALLWNIVNHLEEIEKCNNKSYKKHEQNLRRILRRELYRHRNKVTFTEHKWFYEKAYPKIMRYYWMFNKLIS